MGAQGKIGVPSGVGGTGKAPVPVWEGHSGKKWGDLREDPLVPVGRGTLGKGWGWGGGSTRSPVIG